MCLPDGSSLFLSRVYREGATQVPLPPRVFGPVYLGFSFDNPFWFGEGFDYLFSSKVSSSNGLMWTVKSKTIYEQLEKMYFFGNKHCERFYRRAHFRGGITFVELWMKKNGYSKNLSFFYHRLCFFVHTSRNLISSPNFSHK